MPGARSACRVGSRTLLAKTCSKCHVLKSASAFMKKKNDYWDSHCKACRHKNSKKIDKARNDVSQNGATRRGIYWTPDEIGKLETLIAEGLTHAQIGAILGRSDHAITMAKHHFLKGD